MKTKVLIETETLKEAEYLTKIQKIICRLFNIDAAKKYYYSAKIQVSSDSPLCTNDVVVTHSGHQLRATRLWGDYFLLSTNTILLDEKPTIGSEIAIIYHTCSEYERR